MSYHKDRIIKIIADHLGLAINDIRSNETLEDNTADELDMLEILMEIEDELNIFIDDNDVDMIRSSPIDYLIALVDRLVVAS